MPFSYGEDEYGSHAYGGTEIPQSGNIFDSQIPVRVEVFDNTLAYKSVFQTGAGDLLGIEFSMDESGSRNFTLFFAGFVDIDKKDIIQIKLFGDNIFFTGVVRKIPIEGSTKFEYNYSGFGMNDYLVRANTENQNYSAQTIEAIVDDLLDTIIVPKTPIIKNLAKIDENLVNITITDITFNYISCFDALKQLKELAQSDGNEYVMGVDHFGEFVFMRRSEVVKKTLIVGKQGDDGITDYEPDDTVEEKSKFFVLDKDGAFVTTVSSTGDIDIFEAKLTAPDIDNADISNWANGILLEKEEITRSASIEWEIEKNDPLVLIADGLIRVISNVPPDLLEVLGDSFFGAGLFGADIFGGAQYPGFYIDDTLKIKQVQYIINNNMAMRKISLGSLPVRLDRSILKVNQNIKDLRVSLGR